MQNEKIVIIGASGHLGYNIARKLLNNNKKILILIRKENTYTRELAFKGAKIKKLNFNKLENIRRALKNQDILINTASRNPYIPDSKILKDNYDIIKKIFNSSINTNIKKIINISSAVIYKRKPTIKNFITEKSELNFFENDYVRGKILSEKYIDNFQNEVKKTIIRLYPGWILSEDDLFLTPPSKFFFEKIFKKKLLFTFNGGISVNGVDEVADAVINSIKINTNEKFLLGGHNTTYYNLISSFCKKNDYKALIIKLPNFTLTICTYFFSSLYKMFNMCENFSKQLNYSKQGLKSYLYISSRKAQNKLNYKIKKFDLLINDIKTNSEKHFFKVSNVGKNNYFPPYEINLKTDQRILITGCPGNLGNKFIDFIIDYNTKNKQKFFFYLLIEKKFYKLINLLLEFNIYYGSLNDRHTIKKSLENVSAVFHLASKIYDKSSKRIYETNYTSSKIFCETLIKKKIKRILYISTDSVLGYDKENLPFNKNGKYKPFGMYGVSKKKFEDFLIEKAKKNEVQFTILRSFLFFDKDLFNKNKLTKFIYKKIQPMIGNGDNYRNFAIKENIVLAFFHCLNSKKSINKIYWIGNLDYKIKIKDLYKKLCSINKMKYNPLFIPNVFGFLARVMFESLSLFNLNSGFLFTLSKLNLTITAKVDKIYKDTKYKEVINYNKIIK